ncbi:MAG: TRAP transporter small permease subunit [Chromatiales bacterium]|jgi:TRAP-type mannitol/chloroaromatic compound transport system permease small subunit|nr:TRAP transporter small permease subunit [Chromatiales bacterium]MDX9767415.1 TRAP transporter small permease subunit [Ectothiorhodospiraceae bacterium]
MRLTATSLPSRIAAGIDALNEWVGRAVAWLTLAMVLLTLGIVIARYAFGWGSIAVQESVMYLHAITFMLGAAYTLRHDAHVRVDVFYRGLDPRRRAWVDAGGALFLLLPVCAFILYASFGYVAAAWAVHEGSRETGGLPWMWLLKTLIPVTAVLLGLQGIAQLIHALRVLRGREPPPVDAAEVP